MEGVSIILLFNQYILTKLQIKKREPKSISKSFSKFYFLNYYLESHLHKIAFYIFSFSTVFLYLIRTLESHSRLIYLTSEKFEIENSYI